MWIPRMNYCRCDSSNITQQNNRWRYPGKLRWKYSRLNAFAAMKSGLRFIRLSLKKELLISGAHTGHQIKPAHSSGSGYYYITALRLFKRATIEVYRPQKTLTSQIRSPPDFYWFEDLKKSSRIRNWMKLHKRHIRLRDFHPR